MSCRRILALAALVVVVATTVPLAGQTASAGGGTTFVVNTVAGDDDGVCEGDPDPADCSLPEAINAANNDPGQNQIYFDLPSCPPDCTIGPDTILPDVNETTWIDGFTQLDDGDGSAVAGSPGMAPVVIIDGSNYGFVANAGIQFNGNDNVLRGLILTHFPDAAVRTEFGTSGTVIEMNIVADNGEGISLPGQDHVVRNNVISDSGDLGSGGDGIGGAAGDAGGSRIESNEVVNSDGNGISIGGPDQRVIGNIVDGSGALGVDARDADNLVITDNVVTASGRAGMDVEGSNVSFIGNQVSNSNIDEPLGGAVEAAVGDSTITGNTIDGNHGDGLVLYSASGEVDIRNNLVAENIITGNEGYGISTGAPETTFLGNLIVGSGLSGIAFGGDGSSLMGNQIAENGEHGVVVIEQSTDLVIGGAGGGNAIFDNAGAGIFLPPEMEVPPGAGADVVPPPVSVTISQNGISDNGGLGIELAPEGPNENDPGDGDEGPNRLQNAPAISSAAVNGSLTVDGALDSTPGVNHRVEFFVSESCDPSGFGEGSMFVGMQGSQPGPGPAMFTFVRDEPIEPGLFVTATATNLLTGDTSEFSNCVQVTGETGTPTPTPTPTPVGQTPTPTPTATPTPTPTGTPGPELVVGDVDCDGDADAVDALQVLRHLAALSVNQNPPCPGIGTEVASLFGDVDCDGDVDAVDALTILRHVAGLPVQQFGCDENGTPTPTPTPTATAMASPTPTPQGGTLTVNVTDDTDDGSCDGSHCSLLEAVDDATAGDTIAFDIPSSDSGYDGSAGVWTIQPTSTSPYLIPAGVVVDGTTQTSNRGDTNVEGLEIEIDGSSQGSGHSDCISLKGGNVLRGLVVNRCGRIAVFVSGSNNVVAGNYIGTDATGTEARPYAMDSFVRDGVAVNGDNNRIGGTTVADRNVISGNNGRGLAIFYDTAHDNLVEGNYIGTDRTGSVAVGNWLSGVEISYGAQDNTIGADNIIAFNGVGVSVLGGTETTTGNTITENSIHSNNGLGISNSDGGNLDLAPPAIVSVNGSVGGTACGGCTVEVFSDAADEGATYEGATVADGSGNWTLSVTPQGPNVTAVAIDAQGNSSEFSTEAAKP